MAKITPVLERKIRQFHCLIKTQYPTRKLIIFGSYAKGYATKDSDIDLGVVIDLPNHSQRIEITAQLFHFASQIDNRIEPKCIFWDEYQNADNASILAEIIRTGKEIALL